MDPMTQSAQISSSAEGQNSAAKESKITDKRLVQGSDKSCEVVATSLRFPSQPGSYTPGNYGSEAGPPEEQPDSPIKTSPVSERIKALEALAAKKKEPDFRSDGGYSHFRDRHHEKSPTEAPKSPTEAPKSPTEAPKSPTEAPKSPTEAPKSPTEAPKSPTEAPKSPTDKIVPTIQKKVDSSDQDSPESPFEVLGDVRQMNEFEETEQWMKAHLPPVPDLDAVDLMKGTLTSSNVISKEEKETTIIIPDVPVSFSGVPDAFVDSPVQSPNLKDEFIVEHKDPCVEEEAEFDLSFLPTAYMWDQQEKSSVQASTKLNSVMPASPAPPAGFDSPSPSVVPPVLDAKPKVSDKKPTSTGDIEPPEASEADSSGDSDDTVIEDAINAPKSVPPPSSTDTSNNPNITPAFASSDLSTEEITPPPKSERKLMQVPTINVIETDDPNYSDEEMEMEVEDEDYEVLKDLSKEAPKTPEPQLEENKNELAKTRPLETEFIEGYSPPSSPVDSDVEYSPKHKILKSLPDEVHEGFASKPEALPNRTDSKDYASEFSPAHREKSESTSHKENDEPDPFIVLKKEVASLDSNEWLTDVQDILVKPGKTDLTNTEQTPYTSIVDEKANAAAKDAYMDMAPLSNTSFMQDDIYDRQSFDYDYDVSSTVDDIDEKVLNNAKERFLSDPSSTTNLPTKDSQNLTDITSFNDDDALSKSIAQPSLMDYPENPYSSFQSETISGINDEDLTNKVTADILTDNMANGNSLSAHKIGSNIQQDTKIEHHAVDTTSNSESIDPDNSISEPTDSFVDFMRECLKSRQDEDPENTHQSGPSDNKVCKTGLPHSHSPPTMVMDLEQEQLTISALKELGSSREDDDEEEEKDKVPDQSKANPNATSVQQSYTSFPDPPCSQSNRVFDNTYSKEVEAIDEWVAEAYHLAEHVLTAILTHLSVKDLVHWRDPKKSGLAFGLSMLMLLSLAAFSVISVASYLLLALLCVTITFRIYKSVVQAVQKSSDGHPFKTLIDKDVSIPPETFRKHVDASLSYINRALKQMSRLFLVEDLVDSLKLAVVMWLFTYVGAVFNGITILILADILLFSVPPIYEKNKTQIDQYIDVARTQVNTTMAKLQEKLPGAVKRGKTE